MNIEKFPKSAVIGVGVAGGRYLDALVQAGNPTAIYEPDALREAELHSKFPETRIFKNLADITEWAEATYICTPDHLHVEPTLAAINAGNLVLCEKPVTTSLKDALRLETSAKASKARVMVGNILRLTPTFSEVQRLIRAGIIGEVGSIYTSYIHNMRKYHKDTPWREINQDYLYGGGIHALDLGHWLMNEEPESVLAITGRKLMPDYLKPEDYNVLTKYKSDTVVRMWANANAIMQVHKIDVQIFGSEGTIITDNRSGNLALHIATPEGTKLVETQHPNYPTVPVVVKYINDSINNRIDNHSVLPNLSEAIEVIRIADAAERSIQANGQTIRI